MFGTTRKALFGAPMIEDAMTANASAVAPVAAPAAAMVEPAAAQGYTPPKRSFLDRLDLVADAFSNNNNNAMRLQMQDREAFQNWQATAGQQLEDARRFALFKQQADYERANPKPAADDVFTRDLMRAGIDPNSADGIARYRAKVENTTDPQVVVPLPNGTYIGPKSGLAAALRGGNGPAPVSGAAQAPRTLPADFDFGGPASSAPATFR